MRLRVLLILATTLLGVMVLGGAALAVTKTCSANPCVGTNGPDRLRGTDTKNEIRGLRGPDYIAGKPRADDLYGGWGRDEVRAGNGRDRVFSGRGRDTLYGGGGNDTMNSQDGYEDGINCGIGTDTAYVDRLDRVNDDCEHVFGAGGGPGPNPVVGEVSGNGELGPGVGSPWLRVNAKSTGTSADDVQGTFSIMYPGMPEVARDNTQVGGTIRCLAVTDGNKAQLVGQIKSASGPKADDGTFEKDQFVRIGVLDNATAGDKANFSPGEETFTSCNGVDPTFDVFEGPGFVVKENV